jgi:preprotein translocase subunit YajC
MNQNILTLISIALAILIFVAVTFVSLKLAKKKKDVTQTLDAVGTGITYAQAIAGAISPFLPTIANNIIMIILSRAQQAVTHTEATYKAALATGTAANDTRQAEAISLIKSALALEGIEETADIDKLINTVIPLLVLALPKTHDIAPATTTAA